MARTIEMVLSVEPSSTTITSVTSPCASALTMVSPT
jgi:hypothetical protein